MFDLIRNTPGKKGTKSPASKKITPKKKEKHKESEIEDIDAEFEKEMAEVADMFSNSEMETETVFENNSTKPKEEESVKSEVNLFNFIDLKIYLKIANALVSCTTFIP